MGLWRWFAENWFILVQSIGIIAGFVFTSVSLQIDAKVRRIQNLLTLTEHHRDIWTTLYDRPEIAGLLAQDQLTKHRTPTSNEELFVTLVVLHLNTVFQALKQRMFTKPAGLQRDVHWFFNLPIPHSVWNKLKVLQDDDFVQFVEAILRAEE